MSLVKIYLFTLLLNQTTWDDVDDKNERRTNKVIIN